MELFEDRFLKRFGIRIIIGKGGMGEKTQQALAKYKAVYTSFTGGAGALAADSVETVVDVFWLKELGMPEAVWLFQMKDFGPLVVSMDAHGKSLYQKQKL
jgi:tartrate/fumarate subfamily iron-sulfur-dependent hydro-lyase beta chain